MGILLATGESHVRAYYFGHFAEFSYSTHIYLIAPFLHSLISFPITSTGGIFILH